MTTVVVANGAGHRFVAGTPFRMPGGVPFERALRNGSGAHDRDSFDRFGGAP
jgi:hypothetical protein